MSGVACGYCGVSFTEDQGQPACGSCPLKGGCRFLRCPHCGYENPCTPAWLGRLQSWLNPAAAVAAAPGQATPAAKETVISP